MIQGAEEGQCPRGLGFAALPFAGIKAELPCGFPAPEKARSHQGCDRLAADLEGYQMEGFSFWRGLSKELMGAEPKKLSKYQCCLFCDSSEGGTGVKEYQTAKCSLNHDYFPEFPFPASLRKCYTIFKDVF